MTNLSSGDQGSLPRPIPIEAIIHPPRHVQMSDLRMDPRLSCATHWTTVTADGALVVDLLCAWTELEYSYYHYLDRESFLDDMASGSNAFCSSLLVNALLASACVCFRKSCPIMKLHAIADKAIVSFFRHCRPTQAVLREFDDN